MEFPLWRNGISRSMQSQDEGSIPGPRSELKDLALLQLQHRLQLRLRSDPWCRNSIHCQVAKEEKKKGGIHVIHLA